MQLQSPLLLALIPIISRLNDFPRLYTGPVQGYGSGFGNADDDDFSKKYGRVDPRLYATGGSMANALRNRNREYMDRLPRKMDELRERRRNTNDDDNDITGRLGRADRARVSEQVGARTFLR
jgi:hypothetical protein